MQSAQQVAEHIASLRAMQAAYSDGMTKAPKEVAEDDRERPVRQSRRLRLEALSKHFGGPKALGKEIGSPDTYITAIVNKSRAMGDAFATKIEARLRLDFGVLDAPMEPATFAHQLSYFEEQLLGFFRKMSYEQRDHLLTEANKLATRHDTEPSAANPYANARAKPPVKGEKPS